MTALRDEIPPTELEEIRAAARDASRRSRAEQGLPAKVSDEAVLEQIASLMRPRTMPGDRRAA